MISHLITAHAGHFNIQDNQVNGCIFLQVFLEKGSARKELFAVREGEAHVVGQTRKGTLPLLSLERNDVFGYLPFMDLGQEPRSASIVASKGLDVQELDVGGIQKEYEELSETFRNLIYNLGICILVTTQEILWLFEEQ